MRKIGRILGYLLFGLLLIVAAAIAYLFVAFPKTATAPDVRAEATPDRLSRGKYLVENVTGCVVCHSMRDTAVYSQPAVKGVEAAGDVFPSDPALGQLVAPNITPHALKDWSDGEIIRAMISGVNREGKPLFPIMPYQEYAHMSREDLFAVVAYIRSLEPKTSQLPETKLAFPLNLIVRTIPSPSTIHENGIADRGEYLVTIASCKSCHTPQDDRGAKVPGMDFAGGFEFPEANGAVIRSVNITPDPETGIGKWTREQFVSTFKRFEAPELRNIPVEAGKGNTVMPWTAFSGMTEQDLAAIYEYLRKVKPVRNSVSNAARPM